MRVAIVLAFLLVASFAATFDDVKAIVRNDKCAESSLEMLRPQIHEQIQKLKQVKIQIYFRTQKTSSPKLNFWPSSKKPRQFSMNATFKLKSTQFSEMPLKPPVLDSYLPQTASRMSEPFSLSVIQSLKTQLMLPTTLLSLSSSLFWEDNHMLTVLNSLTTLSDLFVSFMMTLSNFS